MPAVSKKQQHFFGIVRAIQKGEQAPTTPETAKAAADMKKSDVKKFASTKHKGLPNKVVQKEGLDSNDKPFVKKLVGKLRKGSKTHAKQADDLEKAMKEEFDKLDADRRYEMVEHHCVIISHSTCLEPICSFDRDCCVADA